MQKEIYMDRKRSLIDVATPLIAGDYGAYKIVFKRNAGDQIAGMEIEALRPDNVTITDLGRVYDDRCEYVIKTSMYSVPGQVRIRASVLHTDGKLTINEMLFVAKGEFPGGQEVPEDRIPALTSALQYAAEQGQYAETQGDFAKTQGEYAQAQGDYAKEQGDYAAAHAGGDMKSEVFATNPMAGQGVVDRAVSADGLTEAFLLNGVEVDGTQDVTLTKADIGLGSVDNTSDADKPVSTAQQAALDGKADAADVLTKTNTTAFTPTGDYQPATKKYVDDAVEAGGGGGGGGTTVDPEFTGSVTVNPTQPQTFEDQAVFFLNSDNDLALEKRVNFLPDPSALLLGNYGLWYREDGVKYPVYTALNDPVKTYDATLSGSTYSVSDVAHITALTDGVQVRVRFGGASSGMPQLNVNSLGAKYIYSSGGNMYGSISGGTIADLVYYGSGWYMVGAPLSGDAPEIQKSLTVTDTSKYVSFRVSAPSGSNNGQILLHIEDTTDYGYVDIKVDAFTPSVPRIETGSLLGYYPTQSGVFYTSINDPMMVYDAILAPGSMYTLAKTVAHITALSDGVQVRIRFDAAASNATININGLGAKSIYANSAEPAEIKAGMISDLAYYGDKWYVVGG